MEALTARWEAARLAIESDGRRATFGALDAAADRMAARLSGARDDSRAARVAVFVPPGAEWVASLLGIWRNGGVVVPLALSHPAAELEYVLRDAGVSIVIADPASVGMLSPLAATAGAAVLALEDEAALGGNAACESARAAASADAPAIILYTSGTTGKPKGVVLTHGNLAAQVASLRQAWAWTAADRALLVLPLHHVHGIVNVVLSALCSGAACEMPPRFDAPATWDRLASGDVTLFTAVPTIYHRLIAAWEAAPDGQRRDWSGGARRLRLMMSGSAALPVGVLERWRAITGHTLLERYGMTEIGMALANPLHGERRPGAVGVPLPGVAVRLVDDAGAAVASGAAGSLEVRGPGVFHEYWRRPAETAAAFRDGWFRTGDVAVIEDGAYRLLGRASTDILKTGGFKVSALEIEEVMRGHPAIAECAVVGLADDEWGERVGIAIEARAGAEVGLTDLQAWARPLLAPYKLPRDLVCVAALPRNAMGKIVKPRVAALFDRGVS